MQGLGKNIPNNKKGLIGFAAETKQEEKSL